ncbi:MAG: porin [Minicystis sp.]
MRGIAAAVAALLVAPAARAAPEVSPFFQADVDLRVHSVHRIEGENGFAVGRLRLGATSAITSWFFASAQAEWARDKPALLEAQLTLRPLPQLEISAGAGRTPLFSAARDEQVWILPIPELPMVARAFWPGYDAGVEVHRLPTPAVPLEAWLRFGNGSGSALGNDNSDFALDVRLDAVFGRAAPWAKRDAPFGLRMGAGLHAEAAEDRLGITGTTADGYAFYRAQTVSGPRYVGEGHVVVLAGPVKIDAEIAVAREGRSKDTDGNPDTPRVPQDPIYSRGGFVEAAWMITGQRRTLGAWPVRTPWNVWDWGAVEVAARFERIDLERGARDVTAGGATAGAAAVRWWMTSFLSLSAAAYFTAYDIPPVEDPMTKRAWLGLLRATVRVPTDPAER